MPASLPSPTPTVEQEIERYLRTGDHDSLFLAWEGDVITRAQQGDADLREALVAEVERRAVGKSPPAALPEGDLVAFARKKLTPMVHGLFSAAEREPVLAMLERAVVFLTPENIADALRDGPDLSTTWDLANLYLRSVSADLLSDTARKIVGVAEMTTCFVSLDYFSHDERFEDFVVHETAHLLHNCKRRKLGLLATRTREWLLSIDYRKRETFAWACEMYSRIVEQRTRVANRIPLVDEFAQQPPPTGDHLDAAELLSILREAAPARNGWKIIHDRSAPAPP